MRHEILLWIVLFSLERLGQTTILRISPIYHETKQDTESLTYIHLCCALQNSREHLSKTQLYKRESFLGFCSVAFLTSKLARL